MKILLVLKERTPFIIFMENIYLWNFEKKDRQLKMEKADIYKWLFLMSVFIPTDHYGSMFSLSATSLLPVAITDSN